MAGLRGGRGLILGGFEEDDAASELATQDPVTEELERRDVPCAVHELAAAGAGADGVVGDLHLCRGAQRAEAAETEVGAGRAGSLDELQSGYAHDLRLELRGQSRPRVVQLHEELSGVLPDADLDLLTSALDDELPASALVLTQSEASNPEICTHVRLLDQPRFFSGSAMVCPHQPHVGKDDISYIKHAVLSMAAS